MHKKVITKRTQLLLSTIFVLGIFFLYPTNLFAQDFSLTVTPEVQYIRIKPGSKIRHTITLENKSDRPITVTPTVYDFKADGKTGRAMVSGVSSIPYLDIEDINSSVLTVPANKRAQLGLIFSVPEDAPEREYPLTVLFQSEPNSSAINTSQSQLVGAIGSNLIVLVSHQEQLSNLINIDTIQTPKIVDSFSEVNVSPTITNNHFAATNAAGNVRVKNIFDTQVAEFKIFPDTVLGYSSRELRAMKTDFQPEIEPEAVSFAFKPSHMLGLYTVEVTITAPYTSENPDEVIAYDTFTYLALPLLPLAALGVIVVTSSYWIWKRKTTT
ncbi:hypothetical protein KC721_02045 [Candidatus Woesebacteria bacterium]|nr:hypothetical protein [Candidatus Woesebacteria bacterium]